MIKVKGYSQEVDLDTNLMGHSLVLEDDTGETLHIVIGSAALKKFIAFSGASPEKEVESNDEVPEEGEEPDFSSDAGDDQI